MRFFARIFAAYSIFAFAIFGNSAQAADCKPLQILNTIKLEAIDGNSAFLAPVTVNNTPLKFLLDTGSTFTQLTDSAAKALGLKIEESPLRIMAPPSPTTNGLGFSLTYRATVRTFEMGAQRGENLNIQIQPEFQSKHIPEIAGILSTDLFKQLDIDIDFGAARLNYFAADHCDGKVAYWPERPLAIIPMTVKGGTISIPITVDGHRMDALIDTGAKNTLMSAATAKSDLGLDLGSDENPIIATPTNDPRVKVYSHRFDALTFEGVTVKNPKIDIMVDPLSVRTYVD
ncbi:MAG: aspartyl protease family protein, partial [Rhizomicrobium sp.]